MASSTCKSMPIKRLAEFLQEQQEPYKLDTCRSKGVVKKSRREGRADSSEQKKLEATRSHTCNPTSRILKLITDKFISYAKYSTHLSRNSAQTEESVTNSAKKNLQFVSMRKAMGAQQVQNSEAITAKRQCGSMAKRRQIILRLQQSLITSALNKEAETLSSGSHMLIQPKENSTFYRSPPDLPSMTTKQTRYSTPWDNRPRFSKYVRDRVAIKQTTQLLLDYANETQIHQKNGNGNCTRDMFVLDGLTDTMYKPICFWKKEPRDCTNTAPLTNPEVSATQEVWSDFKHLHRDIGIEIGDSILADIIMELTNLN